MKKLSREKVGVSAPRSLVRLSRRDWIGRVGRVGLAGVGALGLANRLELPLWAQQSAAPPLRPLNRFPRMVQEYFVSRVRDLEQANLARKESLQTKADVLAYQREIRTRIRSCFGPFPEKTPLHAQVTGTVERSDYTIEKILFESRPGFLVTANLYLPRGAAASACPGVVASCGHSDNGKAGATYQSFCQGLARQGYVVLILDPVGQGERIQYPNEAGGSRIGVGVQEHLLLGNQQWLVGENFPFWRVWDGIRALDYLLTRPEVDPHQIGITGNSGGGTVTTWLCGLDDRWSMAAPGCFITTSLRNLENELPQDSEQYPWRMLAAGLDHDDFLAALAPKPVIILAKERDYFDVRGAEEAYRRLRRIYGLLGAEENLSLFIGPTEHGYTQENREAMYRWFNRATKQDRSGEEPSLTLESDETLRCTPLGQVADLDSHSVFSYTSQKARRLADQRPPLSESGLQAALSSLLRLPDRQGVPEARILRPLTNRHYPRPFATPYAIETEPLIQAIVYRLTDKADYARPRAGESPTILYVSNFSSDVELRDEPLLAEFARTSPTADLYTCDLRGTGESQPDTCGPNSFRIPYGSDYFYAGHSLMLDAPYVGQKTFDLLRVLDWLGSYGQREVHLVALGRGTLPATFAAMLHPHVTQVTLQHALTSYSDLAETEAYQCPLSSILPEILTRFDLPDCYRILRAKRSLRLIDPRPFLV
jgi:dienelactone hydrolase/pimeloyl-ACP methyl ester carboxylesterase